MLKINKFREKQISCHVSIMTRITLCRKQRKCLFAFFFKKKKEFIMFYIYFIFKQTFESTIIHINFLACCIQCMLIVIDINSYKITLFGKIDWNNDCELMCVLNVFLLLSCEIEL